MNGLSGFARLGNLGITDQPEQPSRGDPGYEAFHTRPVLTEARPVAELQREADLERAAAKAECERQGMVYKEATSGLIPFLSRGSDAGCVSPWYKDPKNLALLGVGGVALFLTVRFLTRE